MQRIMTEEERLVKLDSPFPHNVVSMEYFYFRELVETPIIFHKA